MRFYAAILLALTTSLSPAPASAQSEEISFDLSGETDRHLRLNLINGGVTIKGHDSDQLSISTVAIAQGDKESEAWDEAPSDGLRRLPNKGQDLVVNRDDGEVVVRAGTSDDSVQMVVQVPRDMRLTVRAAMDGNISVDGVNAEMDLNSAAGAIEVWGIRQAASVHAQADDVKASFAGSALGGPATFSSWAGDVDISFPAGAGADLRWRTTYGEVLTDLEVTDIQSVQDRVETNSSTRIEGFTTGKLNGGGPEVSITAFSGDIRLTAQEP